MNPSNRRQWLSLVATLLAAGGAWAQGTYPDRPIRMIVPFNAGGALDHLARILAPALSAELRQQVVVENRGGATGHVGGEFVSRAVPDGYTLLFTASSAQAVSHHLMKLNYRPMEELVPVALAATVNNVVVVHKDMPVNSMAELIAYAKANPNRISYGSTGMGSNLHLAGEMLAMMAGLQMVHVPYNGQALVTDLLSGRIQLHVGNIPEMEQHIKAGALKGLAVTSLQRLPEFPNLPPVADTLPGYAVGAWGMLMAPARTPPEILQRLNAACVRVLSTPEVREGFLKARFNPATLNLAQTREFLQTENARWERVVREARVPMLN
jgi:tripartite-type tricarboxylate transporter receptor subunit TctC